MNDIKGKITEWRTELETILRDYPDVFEKVSDLVQNDEYIAAFNYIDENIVQLNIQTTEKFRNLTDDLFFSLRF